MDAPAGPELLAEPGTTTEPLWVMLSIVLGMIALSGSSLMILMAGIVGLVIWLARTPPEGPQHGRDQFAAPIGFPPIWP